MNLHFRKQLVEALVPAIGKAGRAVLGFQDATVRIHAELDSSPVTAANLASHEIPAAACGSLCPRLPVLSEETTLLPSDEDPSEGTGHRPLDSRKWSLAGRGEFTVNLALLERGRPTAGLLYAPARGRFFMSFGERSAVELAQGGELAERDGRATR